MAGRLILTAVACALLLTAGAGRAARGAQCAQAKHGCFELFSTIAFGSNRDTLTVTPVADGAEIYLMNADGSNVRRLTDNVREDAFPNLSPDGKKIVFDSDRLSGQVNVSDLFLMESDGSGPTFLTRGSSATWSPNGKEIAFHASASGSGSRASQRPRISPTARTRSTTTRTGHPPDASSTRPTTSATTPRPLPSPPTAPRSTRSLPTEATGCS